MIVVMAPAADAPAIEHVIARLTERGFDVHRSTGAERTVLGVVKKGAGIAIYQPDREARVVAHVVGTNRGPLEAGAIQRLFERVIDESRRLERTAEPGDAPAIAEGVATP